MLIFRIITRWSLLKNSIVAFFLLIICYHPCKAATYFIDAARPDNTGSGVSWISAKKTIAAGIALLVAGDTLKIASGTYDEPIHVNKSGTSTNWITIETDDKAGNPGTVTITGRVIRSGEYSGVLIDHSNGSPDYIKIDGRKPNGFIIQAASDITYGVRVISYEGDAGTDVTIQYVYVTGNLTGGEPISIQTVGYSRVTVAYCKTDTTNASMQIEVGSDSGGSSSPNPSSIAWIHHNEVSGTTNSGYSGISILRFDYAEVYDNYFHDLGLRASESGYGPSYIRVRQAHDNKFYNNILWMDHADAALTAFQTRGQTGGTYGAYRNQFYNNTVHIGTTPSSIAFVNDNGTGNEFFNNLVIGNVDSFTESYGDDQGSGNKLYNNVVSGTVTSWFASSGIQGSFSVTTPNFSSQGTSFIALSGSKPSPYWSLTASKDGSPNNLLTVDYLGFPRASIPDVGAFEFNPGGKVE